MVLSQETDRFQALVARLKRAEGRSYALAELADYLRVLTLEEFVRAVSEAPRVSLDGSSLNHLAAMIELSAQRRGVSPPAWTSEVPTPAEPVFGSSLESVRLYLLTRTPVALRRRNLFMDAAVDERV